MYNFCYITCMYTWIYNIIYKPTYKLKYNGVIEAYMWKLSVKCEWKKRSQVESIQILILRRAKLICIVDRICII